MSISLETFYIPPPENLDWANTPGYANGPDSQLAGKPVHLVSEPEGRTLCGIRRKSWLVDIVNHDTCERCTKEAIKRGIITLGDV